MNKILLFSIAILMSTIPALAVAGEPEYFIFFESWRDKVEIEVYKTKRENFFERTTYRDIEFAGELYRMNPDGSEQIRLTDNETAEYGFIPVPGGEYIIFTYEDDGVSDIGRIDYNGDDFESLTNDFENHNWAPNLSDDGTLMAYLASSVYDDSEKNRDSEVFVMNMETLESRQLTNNSDQEYALTIAPDGSSVAYLRKFNRFDKIIIQNLETGEERTLLKNQNLDFYPPYIDPFNEYIATGAQTGTFGNKFMMYALADERLVTEYRGGEREYCTNSKFIPSGWGVVLECGWDESYFVFIDIEKNFETWEVFLPEKVRVADFDFSPDESTIIFTARKLADDDKDDAKYMYNIYRINLDGGDFQQLTFGKYGESWLVVSVNPEWDGGEE